MLRHITILLLAAFLQTFSARDLRGQKPGTMNEYDEESNTVFDEPPEDDTITG